jgi:hypothetical protein
VMTSMSVLRFRHGVCFDFVYCHSFFDLDKQLIQNKSFVMFNPMLKINVHHTVLKLLKLDDLKKKNHHIKMNSCNLYQGNSYAIVLRALFHRIQLTTYIAYTSVTSNLGPKCFPGVP